MVLQTISRTLKEGELMAHHYNDKGKYSEAVTKSRWSQKSAGRDPKQSTKCNDTQKNDLPYRCLVGSVQESDEIPMQNDVRSWVHQNW